MSFVNLMLYSAVIPSYNSEKEKQKYIISENDPSHSQTLDKIFAMD